ncbi:D-alanyl-D-alanine carboxypeptidase [Actinoplanes sp. NPDC051851]|uniref:D-alanyl-D-alanine carboxypeptidase n=1 Tax=Actinoplanes sp. NPDC051851 TaxID=3154753 RepID=UPI00342B324F
MTQAARPNDEAERGRPPSGSARVPGPRPSPGNVYGGAPAPAPGQAYGGANPAYPLNPAASGPAANGLGANGPGATYGTAYGQGGGGRATVPPAPPSGGRASVPQGGPVQNPGWPPPSPAPKPVPEPAEQKKVRRTGLIATIVAAVLAVAVLGTGSALQLTRDLPVATLTTTIAKSLTIPGEALDLPWPSDGSAELMIQGLGKLGGYRAGSSNPIGSVAKVMTAYVILQEHPLTGDEEGPTLTVTAADVADYQSRIPTGQSLVPVTVGEQLTERDALEALMLPSANNIAHQLAVWDSGSVEDFLTKMNKAAADLGMTDTEYTDPSGFLPSTTSTASDQVLLGEAAIDDEVFADIVALHSAEIPVAGTISNYNALLGVSGIFGIKTGSTDEAGGNLLFAAHLSVAGKTLTLVGAVFSQPGANTSIQLAAVNKVVRKLMTAVKKVVKQYQLLAATTAGTVTTAWGTTTSVSTAEPLKVIGWPGLSVPVTVATTTPGAEVTSGQELGTVKAAGVSVTLRSDEASAPASLWWRLTRRP